MPKESQRLRVYASQFHSLDSIRNKGNEAAASLPYRAIGDDRNLEGFYPVGYADVTLEIDSTDTVIENQIASLRSEAKSVKAEAEAKVTELNRKISELLALPLESKA